MSAVASYCTHLREVVLPLWLSSGYLAEEGLFAEQLDFQGRPIRDVPHRAMVQARQIYVYAHAASSGFFTEGGEIALRTADVLLARYGGTGGIEKGIHFSMGINGELVSSARASYTHAFVLLALATSYQLSGDPRLRRGMEELTHFIETNLVDPRFYGVYDEYPPVKIMKSQNPLMHLLEAYLAAHEAWPDGGFIEKASRIVEHFHAKIWMDDLGVLAEYYNEDWSKLDWQREDAFFEPGHQFEWAWLLGWYSRLSGTDQSVVANALWNSACQYGLRGGRLCYDEVALSMQVRKPSHRLWPHTEGAKIAAARAQAGLPNGRLVAEALTSVLNDTFLQRPFAGGWIDRVGSDETPLVDFVPASSLYHLYSAAHCLVPLVNDLERDG